MKEIIHFSRIKDKNKNNNIYLYTVDDKYIESEYETGQYSMFLLVNAQIEPKIKFYVFVSGSIFILYINTNIIYRKQAS